MLRRILPLVAALAALAIGISACGGGADADAYIKDVNDAQTKFAAEAGKLNLANPSGPEDFKKSLDSLVGLVDGLTADLKGITPPEEVKGEHDKLVKAMSDYGTLIKEQKDALGSGNQEKIVEAATKIGTGSTTFSTTFDSTINAINDKLGRKG